MWQQNWELQCLVSVCSYSQALRSELAKLGYSTPSFELHMISRVIGKTLFREKTNMFLDRSHSLLLAFVLSIAGTPCVTLAQQEIGFIEKFALAEDRREALKELIPGTPDYFYFHCLHFQNEGQLADADSMLDSWKSKHGASDSRMQSMEARQVLLAYHQNPKRTAEYLRSKLKLNWDHSAPTKNRAATLPNSLDNKTFEPEQLITNEVARDQSLTKFENEAFPLLLSRKLTPEQLRHLLGRLKRSDLPNIVARIAEELALKDSQGFGWATLHTQLTKERLDELQKLRPELLESDKFVRAYTARLAPAEGTSLTNKAELRSYLERLRAWSQKLPASQNSLKALVLGNLLRLNLTEQKFERDLFVEYLRLPRSAVYYFLPKTNVRSLPLAELNYQISEAALPRMGDDTELVRRYLEHFLRNDENVDAFANWIQREYLEQVFAETKILNGIGDAELWYAKLKPDLQKSIRERVEVRFEPYNPHQLSANDPVQIDVGLKNIDELTVRIYAINTLAHFRESSSKISASIDLDGLVANHERKLKYNLPADRRHIERIDLPELQGRGVWVIDLLGGGQRSRAVIRKGDLIALNRSTDAGQVFQVVDENGKICAIGPPRAEWPKIPSQGRRDIASILRKKPSPET